MTAPPGGPGRGRVPGRALPVAASVAAAIAAVALTVAAVGTESPGRPGADGPRVVGHGAMSTPRAAHQATALEDGRVLLTGGCHDPGCERMLASAEIYDPATGAFEEAPPLSTPRGSHEAVRLPDGRVLVTGGWTGGRATDAAEIYDPRSRRWRAAGSMHEPRMSHNAVPLPDGRILLVGGDEPPVSAEIFDPRTLAFSPVGPMVEGAGSYLPIPLSDGRVLLTGGDSPRAQLFDPATGSFAPSGELTEQRTKHGAMLLPDGRALLVAGSDGSGYRGRKATTETWDPATGRFSPGPGLRAGRHKIRDAVVPLPSGAVLVAGGAPRAELLDLAVGTSTPVEGSLGAPRMFVTATVLPTGEVLIVGGYDARIRPTASAWLFRPGA